METISPIPLSRKLISRSPDQVHLLSIARNHGFEHILGGGQNPPPMFSFPTSKSEILIGDPSYQTAKTWRLEECKDKHLSCREPEYPSAKALHQTFPTNYLWPRPLEPLTPLLSAPRHAPPPAAPHPHLPSPPTTHTPPHASAPPATPPAACPSAAHP